MSKYIRDFFNTELLKKIFLKKIYYSSSVGIDKVNTNHFTNKLTKNISLIQTKLDNGTYKFTCYKEILISKGKGKIPRVISVPTVRDRLVLQRINIYLQERYKKYEKFKLSQTLISELLCKIRTKQFDSYIKIDLSNFYGTINHVLLLDSLHKRKISKQIIKIIHEAINTPTVQTDSLKHNREKINMEGVPQGISISNVLASFYMIDFDKCFQRKKNLYHVRYVDDILILCNYNEADKIFSEVKNYLVDILKLNVNKEKFEKGRLINGFSFLGYELKDDIVKPRDKTIKGLEKTIERLFRDYSKSIDKNYKLFIWNLNLKITGAISDNKKFGWLFYFSQITDQKLLFHLDWFIEKMFKRFNIKLDNSEIRLKRYVRAFKEITLNLNHTKYIPNFDDYDPMDMHKFLLEICGIEEDMSIDEIEDKFYRVVFRSISNLEKDLQNFS